MLPLVTVGVASFNNEKYIVDTLNSFINQSYEGDLEIIIVDDCSSDKSLIVIEKWILSLVDRLECLPKRKIRLIKHNVNSGICVVCNTILENSRGEYICIIGSDDTAEPDRIAHQISALQKAGEEYAVVFGNVYIINEKSIKQPLDYFQSNGTVPKENWIFEDLLEGNLVPAPGALVRKNAIESVGRFDETLTFEDWDMWLRLANKYKFLYLDEHVGSYRRHSASWSSNPKLISYDTVFRILMKHWGKNKRTDKIVARRIAYVAERLYADFGPNASRKWLYMRLKHEPSFASIALALGATLGLRYDSLMSFLKNR